MAQVIVVTSGKGGVGKTTVTANVGIGLAYLGKHVALVDTDLGLRNLDLTLGFENSVVYDIEDVAAGTCELRDAVILGSQFGSLAFLAASQYKEGGMQTEQFAKIIDKLKNRYDYILIDCPAGIDRGFYTAISAADSALIVVNPEPCSLRDADKIAGILEEKGIGDIRLIVNRMQEKFVQSGVMPDLDSIIEALAVRLVGVVPDDSAVLVAGLQGKPVITMEKSKAGKAFSDIAKRLTGERIPIVEVKKRPFFKKWFS